MKLIVAVIALASPLGACATVTPSYGNRIAAEMRANDQYYRDVRFSAQAKIDRLHAEGAMNKWDRLEVQAYHDYLDAKYGESNNPQ